MYDGHMHSISGLFDRLLKPRRPELKRSRAIASRYSDPQLAWKALHEHGLLPAAWCDEPRRRFPWLALLSGHERAEKLRWAPFVPHGPCPDDVAACALLAADVSGVQAAEACGRKLAEGLGAWGVPAADTVLWVPTGLDSYGHQLTDTKPGVWEPESIIWGAFPGVTWEPIAEMIRRIETEYLTASSDAIRGQSVARLLGPWLYAREQWEEAVRAQRRSPLCDLPFADLPDPTEPMLKLFETGYVLLPSSDVLVLGYPVDQK